MSDRFRLVVRAVDADVVEVGIKGTNVWVRISTIQEPDDPCYLLVERSNSLVRVVDIKVEGDAT